MSEDKFIKLLKAAKELNIGIGTIVDFLSSQGYDIDNKPTTSLSRELYQILLTKFQADKIIKEESKQVGINKIRQEETLYALEKTKSVHVKNLNQGDILIKDVHIFSATATQKLQATKDKDTDPAFDKKAASLTGVKVIGKINLEKIKPKSHQEIKEEPLVPTSPSREFTNAGVDMSNEASTNIPFKQEEVLQQSLSQQEVSFDRSFEETSTTISKDNITTAVVGKSPMVAPFSEVKQQIPHLSNEVIRARAGRLTGPNIVGKIDLSIDIPKQKDQPIASSTTNASVRRKRKRKESAGQLSQSNKQQEAPCKDKTFPVKYSLGQRNSLTKEESSEKEIQDQIKATLARLGSSGKSGKFAQRAKFRRRKRDDIAAFAEEAAFEQELQSKVLKVTEFVTANELASMMDISVNQIISNCMSLGMFVSINQRLDAEILTIVAGEFGYKIDFVKPQDEKDSLIEEDNPSELVPRAPIVTIMGHVDHGKTSLLDFIRQTNIIAGEAGGITQHIGAYEVTLSNGRKITFQDTPGHEAFTAMRARGAKITDIVIIVIAADDCVMSQTKEAINHALAAGVAIIFAFNKIDKPGANPDKTREQLANINILVEEWGGKHQSQEISAKTGLNVDLLLEKVLLEADLLDLRANPNKRAVGTVIESTLDKGRGTVITVLVQEGTLRVGDPILAGCYSGRVKALFNEHGQKIGRAGPSAPVRVLGIQGTPTAGDRFHAMPSETEARAIANKRLQLQREQGLRTQKHVTLDEIGRRLAIGNFKELKIIIKGDKDGSIEALSDSLLKLSSDEVRINIITKAVGQISESDVLLASASDAIIIGFQVRPTPGARRLAEQEQIDIRLYSVIYDVINEIKAAMEGMLASEFKEKITANVAVREVFKKTKVGTVAGCMVLDGKITRNDKIRIIRNGAVVYLGSLSSLKRFKDDIREVPTGYECGLHVDSFNDIQIGDVVEAYENVEVRRQL